MKKPFSRAVRRSRTEIQRLSQKAHGSLLRRKHEVPLVDIASIVPSNVTANKPLPDDICLPPHTGGSETHDDYTPLMRLARWLAPKSIVELGTAHGNTVANLCHHCPAAVIHTVNAPVTEQTGELVTFELTADEIGRVYRKYGFKDRVVQILKNTLDLDLKEYVPERSVDLAIVDACHDTSYVVNDFHKVQPFIRPGGIVLLHDTDGSMKGHLAGSYIGCMLLRKEGFDVRQIRDSWWGIWVNEPWDQFLKRSGASVV